MEEVGLVEYWFAWIFAVFFCLWFPSYVVRSKGIPTWGLSLSIVAVFLVLPILAMTFFRDIWPVFFIGNDAPMHAAPNAILMASTEKGASTLDHLYMAMASICAFIGIGQAFFSAWLLFVRHNRESLVRAIRIMWCSALMQVLAVIVLPIAVLQEYGVGLVEKSAVAVGAYFFVLIVVTHYLRTNKKVEHFYPISHQKHHHKKA